MPTASGALVIDADSGTLFAVDDEGRVIAERAVARDAGHLAYDPAREVAFVADRRGDRVVVVDVARMEEIASWPTPVEPFGVALTPDRATVLVATIADRTLVAFDAKSGVQQWRAAIAPEPRGIAVSPDGTRALISSVTTGALDHVALSPPYAVTSIRFRLDCDICRDGDVFARGSGAVLFLDERRAIASYQRAVPKAEHFSRVQHYGGSSFLSPLTHHLALLTFSADPADARPRYEVAQVPNQQPRSLVWDSAGDNLFVVGLGTDTLLHFRGLARAAADGTEPTGANAGLRAGDPCGPDGLALSPERDLLVWCSFTRNVIRVTALGPLGFQAATRLVEGPPLAPTAWTREQHAGMVLFHRNAPQVNVDGALACATCHPDGRADGLAWAIGSRRHQTPVLAGRIVDTAPYKWDGSDKTLADSVTTTVKRMNGTGLLPAEIEALRAYLEALPPPRVPTRDRIAVARGAAIFEATGCTTCHEGVRMTDRSLHRLPGTDAEIDTPSLIGLAASAPYYHDGSAETLDDLLRSYGIGREMADLGSLSLEQRADLKAFLETR